MYMDGYRVFGLDGSQEMIKIALENTSRNVEFFHADIRDFKLSNQFMLALCVYDSLNHLMTKENLEKALTNVFDSHRTGGTLCLI